MQVEHKRQSPCGDISSSIKDEENAIIQTQRGVERSHLTFDVMMFTLADG
jgi:hypothetical protein